jgi:hypothetical protein
MTNLQNRAIEAQALLDESKAWMERVQAFTNVPQPKRGDVTLQNCAEALMAVMNAAYVESLEAQHKAGNTDPLGLRA